jgi:hypothetical protein
MADTGDELLHFPIEVSVPVGRGVVLGREGGHFIEGRAVVDRAQTRVEAALSVVEIAAVSSQSASPVVAVAAISSVTASAPIASGIAVVDRAPSTTLTTPKEFDRAPFEVLRSRMKLTKSEVRLSRRIVSEGIGLVRPRGD